jgi:Nif-specific regulatory protein
VLAYLLQAIPGVSRATCLMRQESGELRPTLTLGPGASSRPDRPVSVRLIDQVCQSREVLLVEDLKQTSDPTASMLQSAVRSLILAPLLQMDEIIGAIQISSIEGDRFAESDLELVAVLAHQLSAVLSGTHLIERLRAAESKLRGQCEVLKSRLGQRPALEEMIGVSPAMNEVRRQIVAVAPSRTTVMIHGETGAGKELVARAIHETSPRADGPFAAVNCSALATGLLESELFGHIKGAFTGAVRDRKGLFEVATGGTLFLDEIGDMPAQLQPKLLRVLEQGTMTPVGATRETTVDVRVVTATHRDLEQEVAAGRFRQDLLFRLNVFTLVVPPLRQRPDDVVELARLFLERFSKEQDRDHPGFTARATAALQAYDWPGNVRELKNEMERASLMAGQGEAVDLAHLSTRLGGQSSMDAQAESEPKGSLKDIMERLEAQVVRSVLDRYDDNRTHAARALGISRQALITKISKLGLDKKA